MKLVVFRLCHFSFFLLLLSPLTFTFFIILPSRRTTTTTQQHKQQLFLALLCGCCLEQYRQTDRQTHTHIHIPFLAIANIANGRKFLIFFCIDGSFVVVVVWFVAVVWFTETSVCIFYVLLLFSNDPNPTRCCYACCRLF